jgi:hypothetical protein
LTPTEQARAIGMVVERVDFAGARGKVAIAFHPIGIQTLAEELASRQKEQSA